MPSGQEINGPVLAAAQIQQNQAISTLDHPAQPAGLAGAVGQHAAGAVGELDPLRAAALRVGRRQRRAPAEAGGRGVGQPGGDASPRCGRRSRSSTRSPTRRRSRPAPSPRSFRGRAPSPTRSGSTTTTTTPSSSTTAPGAHRQRDGRPAGGACLAVVGRRPTPLSRTATSLSTSTRSTRRRPTSSRRSRCQPVRAPRRCRPPSPRRRRPREPPRSTAPRRAPPSPGSHLPHETER